MSNLRTAVMQQALEALTVAWQQNPRWQITESMHALRAALAQQAEPAQAISECIAVLRPMVKGKFPHEQALDELVGYTAPPWRTMVPLTEEEILAAVGWERAAMYMKLTPSFPVDEAKKETLANARAVEKAVWEKNHGQA